MTTAARGQKVRAPVTSTGRKLLGLGTPRISTMLSCTIVPQTGETRVEKVQGWEALSCFS